MPITSNNISVIIPTFNRARVLARALDSVFAQLLLPMEVVVVDDGSTDSTAELVRGNYPTVRYIKQLNQGVSSARNTGVANSQGRWLAFLDSDDEWLPDKLKKQMAAIEQEDMLLCHTDEFWIRNGRHVNPKRKHAKAGGHIFERCLPLCAISPSSVLLRRDLFERVGGFDETLPACEDYDLWLRICARYPVLFVNEPLLRKYGGNADQLSTQHWGMDRFRVSALQKILQSGILDRSQYRSAKAMLVSKCEILINGALKRGKPEQAEFYRRMITPLKSPADHNSVFSQRYD
ncbi:MAG: glycosyltransferase family A protein [Gammaproteobacteria bacterium]|jgi:glycosyltransferase involved in cell wall biosynthesis